MNMLTKDEILKMNLGKICVIGCGGLGGHIIEGLARLGFETLTVVDNDVFDQTNLNRQILATEKNLLSSKAQSASERVMVINSNCKINPISLKFDEKFGRKMLSGHDIVIDAVDNIETKLLIEKFAAELKIPLVHGAVGGWFGQVANIFPNDNILKKIYSNSKSGIESELGNPSFTPAIVANIMVSEAMKIFLGKPHLKNELLTINLLNNKFDTVKF